MPTSEPGMTDTAGSATSFIALAQRINTALDAGHWTDAEALASAALEAASMGQQARWAERFERLIGFARARGHSEVAVPPDVKCSVCAGALGGDRFVAGAAVFICSGCLAFLCEARSWEKLSSTVYWTFAGDGEPTELKCLFCALGRPLF